MKTALESSVTHMQESMRQNLMANFDKFQQMKQDYENIIAPALISQINAINNSYVNNIKEQFTLFKQEIDSDQFKYLDLVQNTSPNPHNISRWPLMVFLSSALVCLLCSTFFHLFYPMSSSNYPFNNRILHDIQQI